MWLKQDDSVYDHPKVLAMGDALFGRLVRTQAWCARHKMGGDIPADLLPSLPLTKKDIARLRELGALDEGMVYHEGAGWHCHDWEDYNPTPDQARDYESRARERKGAAKERKRRQRERERDGTPPVTPDVTRDVTPEVTPEVTPVSRDRHAKSSRDPVPSPSPPQGGGRDGARDNTSAGGSGSAGAEPPAAGRESKAEGQGRRTPEARDPDEWRRIEEAERAASLAAIREGLGKSELTRPFLEVLGGG